MSGHDLTLNDLNVVYNLLFRLKAKWREIGLQLGVSAYTLDSIQSEANIRDDGQRLLQVLSEWLRNAIEPRPSWPRVVDALRSEPVRECDVAEKVRRKHCPDHPMEPKRSFRHNRRTPPGPTPPAPNPDPRPRWQYGLLLIGTALSVVFAIGGIALIIVGIVGLSDNDSCSIGPQDSLSSFNLLSGIVFLSGVFLTALFFTFFCCERNKCAVRVMTGVIVVFIAFSIVITIADMIYGFYVASQVLPNVEKWENDTALCEEAIFRSSFGVIIVFFLILFAIMMAVASILSYWVFKKIIHTRPVAECLHLE